MKTIYQVANQAMNAEVARYLNLIDNSDGLNKLEPAHLSDSKTAQLFAAGIGISHPTPDVTFLINEFLRKSAIPFDSERAVTVGVYQAIRPHANKLFIQAEHATQQFQQFTPICIQSHPYLLPVFQNIVGYSKAQLRKRVGSISDSNISKPASVKLSVLLTEYIQHSAIDKSTILQKIEVTLEGIVRDLVGRILFEEIVANALQKQDIYYLREKEYTSLFGVIYDFRADFVIPDAENPLAFIEVRKSSSRHASLYAKDKMFSAINWKGKHKNLIGVIVVEGDWTQAALRTLSHVFDYVIPLHKVSELARTLRKALDGDETVLRWLIDFKITPSPKFTDKN